MLVFALLGAASATAVADAPMRYVYVSESGERVVFSEPTERKSNSVCIKMCYPGGCDMCCSWPGHIVCQPLRNARAKVPPADTAGKCEITKTYYKLGPGGVLTPTDVTAK
jgi:hypothetical protein